jgi:glycosyltransferase involved in cell wall biosynthesis
VTDASAAPRISVALCTHNGERYLEAQVRSILAQTVPVHEIVLSDDASSDGGVALVERIVGEHGAGEHGAAGRAHPVDLVVLRNPEPLGVTANFEQALRRATGELIALSDQDDVWRRDRLARAIDAFAARPGLQLVASDAQLVDERGRALPSSLFGTLGVTGATLARWAAGGATAELLKRNLLTGATMLVRRELVERAAPFPASWVHDEWLAIVASCSGGAGIVERRLIDYRQHGANQIGVTELGLAGRFGRLAEPRAERNARLLARAGDLAARLPELVPGDARLAGEVAGKLAHERVRSALPVRRRARLAPVLAEWRTGRYGRFGLGAQDVLRDLVQPA